MKQKHQSGRTVALYAPCSYLASALVFVKKLRPPEGPCVITSKAVWQSQIFCLNKLKKSRAATLTFVTATVCDRRNAAAVLKMLLAVVILDRTAAAANVT